MPHPDPKCAGCGRRPSTCTCLGGPSYSISGYVWTCRSDPRIRAWVATDPPGLRQRVRLSAIKLLYKESMGGVRYYYRDNT